MSWTAKAAAGPFSQEAKWGAEGFETDDLEELFAVDPKAAVSQLQDRAKGMLKAPKKKAQGKVAAEFCSSLEF